MTTAATTTTFFFKFEKIKPATDDELGGQNWTPIGGQCSAPIDTKGSLSKTTAKLMVFKLIMTASRTWRCLKGDKLLPKVVEGVTSIDGVEAVKQSTNVAA
jgi:hypothetical protein